VKAELEAAVAATQAEAKSALEAALRRASNAEKARAELARGGAPPAAAAKMGSSAGLPPRASRPSGGGGGGGGDDDDDADGGPDAPRRREAAEREQWQMHMEEQMQERLRVAKSESEATLAEMADVRRLSARLTAEREMMQVVFAEALASSESDETAGSLSVSRLLEQLCDERDERAHETRVHGAEMLQLHRESSRSRRTISREKGWAGADCSRLADGISRRGRVACGIRIVFIHPILFAGAKFLHLGIMGHTTSARAMSTR
jgi:hypothetical protein